MKYIDRCKYYAIEEIQNSKRVLIISIIVAVVGVILGIVLSASRSYVSVLFDIDEPVIEYITGSANIGKLFFKNLSLCILGCAIIFLLCLHKYTGWLGYIYVLYQATIQMIVIVATMNYSGITAVIRSILIYIPINFALLFLLIILYSYLYTKAIKEWKYKQSFGSRFVCKDFWYCIATITVAQIVLYIISYLLLPMLMRGIYIISF